MINNPIAIIMALFGILALSFWLDRHCKWASRIGASTLIILLSAAISNCGLIAHESIVYSAISGPVTSLAIIWLLFAVDFKQIKLAGPKMLAAFGLAAFATLAGITIAIIFLHPLFNPENLWKIGGSETGSYIGGGVNLTALAREFKLDKSVFAAIAAADNIVTTLWMGATLLIPVLLASTYPKRGKETGSAEQPNPLNLRNEFKIFDFSALVFIGFVIIILSKLISRFVPFVPEIIFLSTLALIVAQMKWIKHLSGSFLMGIFALNLFLATMGIGAKISEVIKIGPKVFYFASSVVFVHGILIYSVGKLLKIDIETLSVASQAAIGGPSTAMALASSKGWNDLILPGALVGLLGYAVGNYLGVLVAYATKYFVLT